MKHSPHPELSRRAWLLAAASALVPGRLRAVGSDLSSEVEDFLFDNLYMSQSEIDALVAGRISGKNRKFDPDLGYISADDFETRNSVDGAALTYTFDRLGARRLIAYSGRPCRINTYGDSYTEGGQVSDGETWQERLGAHIGEPVRNFGVGSYSVYQAYLRMKLKEALAPGDAIIFNIYSEDHYRSLKPMVSPPFPRSRGNVPLGIRPYLSANAGAATLLEHGNPCPTPASLRLLQDRHWLGRAFGGEDEIGMLFIRARLAKGRPPEKYAAWAQRIARERRYGGPMESAADLVRAIDTVEEADALFASRRVLARLKEFAAAKGKRLLVVLSYAEDRVWYDLGGGKRFDQSIVDFLQKEKIAHVDLLEAHRRDYASFRVSPADYTPRYYVQGPDTAAVTLHPFMGSSSSKSAHYNPMGNEFEAFAIIPRLVQLLNPKPPAYR